MINSINKVPNEYIAYDEIEICSNKIIGGGNLVIIGDVIPFYVGVGSIPKVWLKALVDIKKRTFIDVVEASISKHSAIKIISRDSEIAIRVGDVVVLKTDGNNKKKIKVTELDLRPLGLNIYGDNSTLHAGGINISKNILNGTGTLVSLG